MTHTSTSTAATPSRPASTGGTLRQAVLHQPNDLRIEQLPVSDLEPGDVLLRVDAALACGTDVRIYQELSDYLFARSTGQIGSLMTLTGAGTIVSGVQQPLLRRGRRRHRRPGSDYARSAHGADARRAHRVDRQFGEARCYASGQR